MKTGLKTIGEHVGQRFGRLVVERLVGGVISKRRPFMLYANAPVVCRCDCGRECVKTIRDLIMDGRRKDCGCGASGTKPAQASA